MENCQCGNHLRIGATSYSVEDDHTPDLETKVFVVMPMLCVNPDCTQYAGTDLSNPTVIVKTIRNRIV